MKDQVKKLIKLRFLTYFYDYLIGDGINLLYSAKPFSKGLHEFGIKIEKFNKKSDHLYVILLREEEKESGANQYSPYHCLFCSDSNNMISHPSKTSNFAPKLEEGSIIEVKIDVEVHIILYNYY